MRLGEQDEIEIAGAMVMRDYRREPEASRRAFTHDGWLRTGDVGVLTDGHLRVVDRLRDLVITGGVNVSPVEVEQVLALHPAVADCAVTGRPDPEWGERVVAHVVPRDASAPPTLDDLRALRTRATHRTQAAARARAGRRDPPQHRRQGLRPRAARRLRQTGAMSSLDAFATPGTG